jgi:hypothetical protein
MVAWEQMRCCRLGRSGLLGEVGGVAETLNLLQQRGADRPRSNKRRHNFLPRLVWQKSACAGVLLARDNVKAKSSKAHIEGIIVLRTM